MLAATAVVFTVNVAELFPAGTLTVARTVAEELLLESFTVIPPVGAAPLRVTVPVELVPPVTEVGVRLTPVKAGAVSVSVAETVTPFQVPEIVADFWEETPVVFTEKAADVCPAWIFTLAGTVTFERLLLSRTVAPATGAPPSRVTVPVADCPPGRELGETEMLASARGSRVSVALCEEEPNEADI